MKRRRRILDLSKQPYLRIRNVLAHHFQVFPRSLKLSVQLEINNLDLTKRFTFSIQLDIRIEGYMCARFFFLSFSLHGFRLYCLKYEIINFFKLMEYFLNSDFFMLEVYTEINSSLEK